MLDILTMTDAPTPSATSPSEAMPSINTGAVIGGTTAGVTVLVILLLGSLVYNKRRKEMKLSGLHGRYIKFCVYHISKSILSNLSPLKVFLPSNGICSPHPANYSFILGNVIHNYNLLLYIGVYL